MITLMYLLLLLKSMAGGHPTSLDTIYALMLLLAFDAGTVFMTLAGVKFLRKES